MGVSAGQTPILRSQSMSYATGCHTVYHHRYHIVWVTKYRYKVLEGTLRERIRTIIRQVCKELGVQIVSGGLSKEHVHMFVEIPPHVEVGDVGRRVKGRSSHRCQRESPELRQRYWGRHFWARGYFCTTSGNITDEAILQYSCPSSLMVCLVFRASRRNSCRSRLDRTQLPGRKICAQRACRYAIRAE